MKVAWVAGTWFGVMVATAAGCAGTSGEASEPVVTVAPDDFVMRDVRKDAARYLNCQVPSISVRMGAWAGSEGNVTAQGCGSRINYYLRCLTPHQCTISPTD